MTEAEWLWAATPSTLLEQLAPTARKRRLFCAACCWRVIAFTDDPRVSEALMIAERYADGWEQRVLLTDMGEEISRHPDPPMWRNYDRGHFVARAVGAVCRVGTDFESQAVLDAIAQLFPYQTPDDEINEIAAQRALLVELFGNPFRTTSFNEEWRTDTVTAIAREMYLARDFSAMPILADALQDAGCDNDEVLRHCREQKEHVRGCWVVDGVLGKA